jgi:hypothetical protein
MAYVPVPKDLAKVKSKVMFNLTKRQLVCFGGGALVGVPLFFLLKGSIGSSIAALVMVFSMLPFFAFAIYEKNGQPLEKILYNVIQTLFVRPKQRPYQTNNAYSALMRKEQMEKEIRNVINRPKRNGA